MLVTPDQLVGPILVSHLLAPITTAPSHYNDDHHTIDCPDPVHITHQTLQHTESLFIQIFWFSPASITTCTACH